MFQKQLTPRDSAYLDWIATLPCVEKSKDCMGDVVAHHTASSSASKKGSDYSCVPLCVHHHAEWHNKHGKKGPFPEEALEQLLEQLQHHYLTTVKKGE